MDNVYSFIKFVKYYSLSLFKRIVKYLYLKDTLLLKEIINNYGIDSELFEKIFLISKSDLNLLEDESFKRYIFGLSWFKSPLSTDLGSVCDLFWKYTYYHYDISLIFNNVSVPMVQFKVYLPNSDIIGWKYDSVLYDIDFKNLELRYNKSLGLRNYLKKFPINFKVYYNSIREFEYSILGYLV